MPRLTSVAIFCEVVDNLGDIGVCWRLARRLAAGHGMDVTLVVDHLPAFRRLCEAVDTEASCQSIAGVCVRHWSRAPSAPPCLPVVPDLVIEAFGCRLPEETLLRMAARRPMPVWVNLEYLSAETWVEGCHRLASPHPALPLVRYFFFPGFTERTGGLLFEPEIVTSAQQETGETAGRNIVAQLTGRGVEPAVRLASLFCYPHAPVASLFDAWRRSDRPVVCLVPEGVARSAVETFLSFPATPGAWRQQDSLRVHVIPFLSQPDYDRLLRACDVNFVRGEDSFVRAQWARRPFLWQIYPQEDEAHIVKLDAFLDRYACALPDSATRSVRHAWHAWNAAPGCAGNADAWWPSFADAMPHLDTHAEVWAKSLWRNGDLADNLIEFASKFG